MNNHIFKQEQFACLPYKMVLKRQMSFLDLAKKFRHICFHKEPIHGAEGAPRNHERTNKILVSLQMKPEEQRAELQG